MGREIMILNLEKDVFYVCGYRKTITGYRQSNRTVLTKNDSVVDSDSIILEDCYGHRYKRTIDLEKYAAGFFVFEMI